MDRRAMIAIALSFVVLFGSNFLFQKLGWIPSPEQQRVKNEARPDSTSRASAAPGASEIRVPNPAPGPLAEATPSPARPNGTWEAPANADSVLTIDHPLYTARIRARGARLLSVVLKNYKDGDSGRATLAADPLVALDVGDLRTPASLADVPFSWAARVDAAGQSAKLTFTARVKTRAVCSASRNRCCAETADTQARTVSNAICARNMDRRATAACWRACADETRAERTLNSNRCSTAMMSWWFRTPPAEVCSRPQERSGFGMAPA